MEPASSWILVVFLTTEPQWELPDDLFFSFFFVFLPFLGALPQHMEFPG